jgi:hypothetical protein
LPSHRATDRHHLWPAQKIIPFNKVVGIYKKSTAIVFSNALEVVTRKSRVRLAVEHIQSSLLAET